MTQIVNIKISSHVPPGTDQMAPLVITSSKYKVLEEEISTDYFTFKGLIYPLECLGNLAIKGLKTWGKSFYYTTKVAEKRQEISSEVRVFNTQACVFEKVDKEPDNIGILIEQQEKVLNDE